MTGEKVSEVIHASDRWSDFRALYASDAEAYRSYADLMETLHSAESVGGDEVMRVRWAKRFVDSAAAKKQVLLLPLLLAGFLSSASTTLCFETFHSRRELPAREVARGILTRGLLRFLSGGMFVLGGVGLMIGAGGYYLAVGLADQTPYVWCIIIGCLLIPPGACLYRWSRVYGLPPILRQISRGVFDVYEIKVLKRD